MLLAAAGWATFAPAGRHRFAATLAIVFVSSMGLWFMLGWMQLTPQRFKGIDHPEFYPSELMVLIGPPALVAIGLNLGRSNGGIKSKPSGWDQDLA